MDEALTEIVKQRINRFNSNCTLAEILIDSSSKWDRVCKEIIKGSEKLDNWFRDKAGLLDYEAEAAGLSMGVSADGSELLGFLSRWLDEAKKAFNTVSALRIDKQRAGGPRGYLQDYNRIVHAISMEEGEVNRLMVLMDRLKDRGNRKDGEVAITAGPEIQTELTDEELALIDPPNPLDG